MMIEASILPAAFAVGIVLGALIALMVVAAVLPQEEENDG